MERIGIDTLQLFYGHPPKGRLFHILNDICGLYLRDYFTCVREKKKTRHKEKIPCDAKRYKQIGMNLWKKSGGFVRARGHFSSCGYPTGGKGGAGDGKDVFLCVIVFTAVEKIGKSDFKFITVHKYHL